MRRKKLTPGQIAALRTAEAADGAALGGRRIAGDVHVWTPAAVLIRTVRGRLAAPVRRDRRARWYRRAAYLAALAAHAENRALYQSVTRGIDYARALQYARVQIADDVSRFGPAPAHERT